MTLKDKLISSFMAFENTVDVDSEIHDIRSQAIAQFEAQGFPGKKQEDWKYTSLNTTKFQLTNIEIKTFLLWDL